MSKYLYRVELRYDCYGFYPDITVKKFEINKETECYYYISYPRHINGKHIRERKVLKNAIKGFARPTIEQAIEDFKKRKLNYKYILEYKIKCTNKTLKTLENKYKVEELINKHNVCIT